MFKRAVAVALLKEGIRRGFVSDRFAGDWPYNVWAVTSDGIALEAQWEADGKYHGYPMLDTEPLRGVILKRWKATS